MAKVKIKSIRSNVKGFDVLKKGATIQVGYTGGDKVNLIAIVQNKEYGYTFIEEPNNDMDKVTLDTVDALIKGNVAKALDVQRAGYTDPVKKYRGYAPAPNNLYITGALINNLEVILL